jgi:predicted TIM-barrel enzyme
MAVPEAPILVGSGATAANLAELAKVANGAIVGSSLKVGRRPEGEIDIGSAREFVAAAREVGWLES